MRKLLLLFILLCGCETTSTEVYFCHDDDCEAILTNLTLASSEIHCAFYDLNLPGLIEALRVSEADIIMDYHYYQKNVLLYEGLTITPGKKGRTMHNKFCIFDGVVVTGSLNPTYRGVNQNDNNLLLIRSKKLARKYLKEFDELTGPDKKSNGLQGKTKIYFCPEDCSSGLYTTIIDSAADSVYFMAFSFTSDDIGDALVRAYERGISVQGVVEKRQNSKYSEYTKLKDAGVDIIFDANPATMHHKVFIIDNKTVITGSANPTKNGLYRNDENIVILHDEKIASEYLDEFASLFG